MTDGSGPRLRIAWVEEGMSSFAAKVVPYISTKHDVSYLCADGAVPEGDLTRVVRVGRKRYMKQSGFELSKRVNQLYRDGLIDLAVMWFSVGFGIRRVPFISVEGTSVWAEIQLFAERTPRYKRAKFATGWVHYALPEIICNRRARRVVTCSQALKDDIVRLHHLPDERVQVIHYGAEEELLALYEHKPSDLRPRIVYIGRLHYRKGIAAAVEEFGRRRDIDAEFLIVGDGPDRGAMEAMAADDPRVKLLGHVGRDELASILRTTNVFAFPTYYEGFGLAYTEAMASGHACVSYDIPFAREVMGDTGILVPMGDVPAFVDELAALVANPDRIPPLAKKAHDRAHGFSWPDAEVAMERLIRDVGRTLVAAPARETSVR